MDTIFVGEVNQQYMSRVLIVSFQQQYQTAVFILFHKTKKSIDTFVRYFHFVSKQFFGKLQL